MSTLFIMCAIFGGTLLVCQFVMTMLGLGHAGADFDTAHSLEIPHDVAHIETHAGETHDSNHSSATGWFFGVLTLRNLTAATTFFGLAGFAAHEANLSVQTQCIIATATGLVAIYGVHSLMRSLVMFGEDGTLRIDRAVGLPAAVYLTVPGKRQGAGKVQFKLQNRVVEYAAVTDYENALKTGERVRIVGVINANTLSIEPLTKTLP
jgi:hypothetical protein